MNNHILIIIYMHKVTIMHS